MVYEKYTKIITETPYTTLQHIRNKKSTTQNSNRILFV